MNPFSHLNLDGVAVTAQITAGGLLEPIDGAFDKLVACVRSTVVPRIHTLVVAEGQREELGRIVPKLLEDNPHAPLVVLFARDVAHAANLLAVDAQTRWGEIEDYSAELSRHRVFYERPWLRTLVDDFIAAPDGGYLLLVGQPGFGKSAFIVDMVGRRGCQAHHFVKRRQGDWNVPDRILNSLSAQLRRSFTLPLAAGEEGRTTAAVFNVLLHRVSATLGPEQKAVICLDGLDESFGPDGQFQTALAGVLPECLPAKVKIILTSRPGWHLGWLANEPVDLDGNSKLILGDIRGYVQRQSDSRNLGLDSLFIDELVKACDGCFAAAVLYLWDGPDLTNRLAGWRAQPTTIPYGLDGWLTKEWHRLISTPTGQPDDWPRLVKTVMGVMALAASPLSRDQLDVIFPPGEPSSPSVPVDTVRGQNIAARLDRILSCAAQFFDGREAASSSDSPYRFFNTRFPEFIIKKGLTRLERAACRLFLAAACADWRTIAEPMRKYALRHGPRHLIEAEAWGPLEALLKDLQFLEAKAEANLAFELARDLNAAADAMTAANLTGPAKRLLGLLGEAVLLDVHFLDRHPSALLQCLWNKCWWYDCDKAQHHYLCDDPSGPSDGPWSEPGEKLSDLLVGWRREKEGSDLQWTWVRSLRPPVEHLRSGRWLTLRGHEGGVTSVSFSPANGRVVASGSKDETGRLWDAETGRQLHLLPGHESSVNTVCISPDGRLAATCSGRTIHLWDAGTGEKRLELRGHEDLVKSVAFCRDGNTLASGSDDQTVRLWTLGSQRKPVVLRGHEDWVNSVTFSPDGKVVASGSSDDTVRLWSVDTGENLCVLKGHGNVVNGVSFSPDGKRLASASEDGTVRVWEVGTVPVWRPGAERVLRGHKGNVTITSVCFSPKGSLLASASGDGTVVLWDMTTWQKLRVLRGSKDGVTSVSFSPNGQLLASGSNDGTGQLWKVSTGEKLRGLRGNQDAVYGVTISPDGRLAASWSAYETPSSGLGSEDLKRATTIRLWNAVTGLEVQSLLEREHPVEVVAISPDGHMIASGSNDGTVRLWDLTGREPPPLKDRHANPVDSLTFSPDDGVLISRSVDDSVRFWNTVTGEEIPRDSAGDPAVTPPAEAAWRAIAGTGETAVERTADGTSIAWFPEAVGRLQTTASGDQWAGLVDNHVFLIRLERGDG